MHPDVANALRLQDIDLKIAALRREIDLLPLQVAEIEKQLAGHLKQLEQDKEALAANQRDRRKLEGDVQTHHQKISKLKDQMLQAKTNEQYRAFQHEIEYAEREIGKCEDRILELMLSAEALEGNVKRAEEDLKKERALVDAQKKKAQEATAKDKAELQKELAARAETARAVSPDVLAQYERLRTRLKDGRAVAEAANSECMACQMSMRPQYFQDVKRGDAVLYCESCRRILYYHAPVNLEGAIDELPQTPAS